MMKPYSVLFPVLALTIWALTIWAERADDLNLEADLAESEGTALSGEGGSEEHAHRAAAQTEPPELKGGEGQMTLQVNRQGAMVQQNAWTNSTRALEAERADDLSPEADLVESEGTALSGEGGSEEHAHRAAAQTEPPELKGGEGQMTLQVNRQGAMVQQNAWTNSTRALEAARHVARHDVLLQDPCDQLSKFITWAKADKTKTCILDIKDVVGNPAVVAKGVNFDGQHEGLKDLLGSIPGFKEACTVKAVYSLVWNSMKLLEEHACGAKKMSSCKEGHAMIKVALASFSLLVVVGAVASPPAIYVVSTAFMSWFMTHGATDWCDKIEKAYKAQRVKGLIEALTDTLGTFIKYAEQRAKESYKELKAFAQLSLGGKLEAVAIIVKQLLIGLAACVGNILHDALGELSTMFEESNLGQQLASIPVGGSSGPDHYWTTSVNVNCIEGITTGMCALRSGTSDEARDYPVCVCYNPKAAAGGVLSSAGFKQYLCSKDCYDKTCSGSTPGTYKPQCGCTDNEGVPCSTITKQGIKQLPVEI